MKFIHIKTKERLTFFLLVILTGSLSSVWASDLITGYTMPTRMEQNQEVTFTVSYETNEPRDIFISLRKRSNWTVYGSSLKTVNGTGTVQFTIPASATSNMGAHLWQMQMREHNGDWRTTVNDQTYEDIGIVYGIADNTPDTWYVSTTGNDSDNGSEATPFATIQKATEVAGPGDQVYIKAGTYTNKVEVTISGEANNWVTYDAYPGDELQVILDGDNFEVKASYVRVSGIKVQNAENAILVEGPDITDVTISNNHTYNSVASGIIVWGIIYPYDTRDFQNAFNIKILNNKVEKACNGGWNECITIASGVIGFEISGNEIWGSGLEVGTGSNQTQEGVNGGEGIDIKSGIQNGIIANNYLHDLYRRAIYLDAAGGTDPSKLKPVMKDIEVYNNIAHNCEGQGIAIMTEGIGDATNIDIFNNVLYNNTEDGIMYYKHPWGTGSISNIRTYNNSIYGNPRYGMLLDFPGSTGSEYYNNICYNNGTDFKADNGNGEYTATNNLYGTNPLFTDVSAGNFKLQNGSPAINAGTSSGAPLNDFDGLGRNGAVDIGAFEYEGTSLSLSNHDEVALKQKPDIYPNPVNETIFVRANKTIKAVKLYNLNGDRLISKKEINGTKVSLPSSHIKQHGIYLLQVEFEDGNVYMKKMVK